jgi:hypothetical protein
MGYPEATSDHQQTSAFYHTLLLLLIGAVVYSYSQASTCFKKMESVLFNFKTLSLKPAASPLEIWTQFPEGEHDAF